MSPTFFGKLFTRTRSLRHSLAIASQSNHVRVERYLPSEVCKYVNTGRLLAVHNTSNRLAQY